MIAVLVVLFTAAGTYLLWRVRPQPLPWHPVGTDRIETPAFDIADEKTRLAMGWLQSRAGVFNGFRGRWLALACAPDPIGGELDGEVYVLSIEDGSHDMAPTARRVTVELQSGGSVLHERLAYAPGQVSVQTQRTLDESEAEAFRTLLLDRGYPRMPPAEGLGICHGGPMVTLESCIRGRYYGVVRHCEVLQGEPVLADLAAEIEAFALEPPGSLPPR